MASENQTLIKTDEDLSKWILRKLGSPTIEIHLTKEQLTDALDEARRWFAAYKGEKRYVTIPTIAAQGTYELDEDVDVVLDVVQTANQLDFSLLLNPFTFLDEQQIPYNIFAAPTSGGLYSTLVQAMQNTKMAKRIIGAEFDWRQEDRQLFIFPVPATSANVIVHYKTSYFEVKDLAERDHMMYKRYALAKAKETLGHVWNKYGAFPTAQGQTAFNGAAMLAAAEKEIAALDKEIMGSGFAMGISVG